MVAAASKRQTRARSPEAREARRLRMLEAAEAILVEEPFADIHMARVAKRAGLAKGTLYLYFESKEALFLAVVERRLAEWFVLMREALGRHAYIQPDALAGVFVRQLRVCAPLTRLLALQHVVLEQNINVEDARAFKRFIAKHVARLGLELERLLPALGERQGARVWMHVLAIIVGLAQSATPSESVAEALRDRELADLDLDFDAELAALLTTVFRGAG